MAILHWFGAQLWRQRLQSCVSPSNCRSAKIFSFSVEELYFQLLRQTKLETPRNSYTELEELYQRYVQDHPSFDNLYREIKKFLLTKGERAVILNWQNKEG